MALPVTFLRGETNRYRSVIVRADGVQVAFEGGAYNTIGGRQGSLPHDLAHLVVEDELALTAGVWGVLAAGGLFGHAQVVAGRQPPHAAARSRAVIDAAGDRIMQAELLTRAVCDAVRGEIPRDGRALRRAVGERWWTDALTADAVERCASRLRAGAAAWAALPEGGALEERWPHRVDAALARARPPGR